MNATRTLLALALLGAAGMAHAAGNCTIALKGDDAMKFDLKEATELVKRKYRKGWDVRGL